MKVENEITCFRFRPQSAIHSMIEAKLQTPDGPSLKKNGCESGFPFFIVPSLLDKKMAGPFTLTVYSDKGVVIQMLDDDARKL